MSKTLEILAAAELKKRIAELQSRLDETRRELEPVDRLKELWREGKSHFYKQGHSERESFLSSAVDLARVLRGIGRPPGEVRGVLQQGFDAYAPVVGILD